MALSYDDAPEAATIYASESDYRDAVAAGYEQDENHRQMAIDLEEIALAEAQERVLAADIGIKRKMRAQLERLIADYERDQKAGPAPW